MYLFSFQQKGVCVCMRERVRVYAVEDFSNIIEVVG